MESDSHVLETSSYGNSEDYLHPQMGLVQQEVDKTVREQDVRWQDEKKDIALSLMYRGRTCEAQGTGFSSASNICSQ